MCTYRTLYYNDKIGYVIYCDVCSQIQLGFGCIMINFYRDEFNSFRRVITEIISDHENITMCAAKSITIPTPFDQMFLLLSGKEINILHSILEEADTNLSVKDFMNLF